MMLTVRKGAWATCDVPLTQPSVKTEEKSAVVKLNEETEHFSEKNGALGWSILVGQSLCSYLRARLSYVSRSCLPASSSCVWRRLFTRTKRDYFLFALI